MENNYKEIIKKYFPVEFTGEYTLDNIRKATSLFGSLKNNFRIIHIAGTNGKGSVSKMLFSILKESSKKVGVFTSPQLLDMRERFETNTGIISENEFIKIVNRILELEINLSYFDKCVLVALEFFKKEKCEYVILEVGMGGLHDTTNIVRPYITTITSIGLDHQNVLGDTIEEISEQKAGIIKKDIPVVLNFRNKVIEEKAKKENAKIIFSNKEFETNLRGDFQRKNAGIAYQISKYIGIEERNILDGLMKVDHKGRLDYIKNNLIIDGAHNIDSLSELKKYIDKNLSNKFEKFYYCFGIKKGKNVKLILDIIGVNQNYILVDYVNIMLESKATIESQMKEYGVNIFSMNSEEIIKKSDVEKKSLFVIFGSLYMVGEFYK